MGLLSTSGNRLGAIVRVALLIAGLSTYLISPDDVVWRFIKTAPHARALEHVAFGISAAFLGLALILKVKASVHPKFQDFRNPSAAGAFVASLLQAIGIGSLLPLPGFLLLVSGDVATSLLLGGRNSAREDPNAEPDSPQAGRPLAFQWRDALSAHIGLGLAFLSMVIFSVLLIDRVADVLFAITALVSIAANARRFSSD